MKMRAQVKVWSVAVGCMAVLVALSFQSLQAEIVPEIILEDGYLEIEYSAGSGQNVSYHVIDFASTGGESFAFAYHFDGPTNRRTMHCLPSMRPVPSPTPSRVMISVGE